MIAVQNPSIEYLEKELVLRNQKIAKQNDKIIYLEEQLNWLKRQIFGKRCLLYQRESARVRGF